MRSLIRLSLLSTCLLPLLPAHAKDRPPPFVEVVTVAATQTPIAAELRAVATLRASESVQLKPEVAGRVVTIGFSEGQNVNKGQLLVKLDDALLQAEQGNAQAAVDLAQAEFQRYQALFTEKQVAELDFERKRIALVQARASLKLLQARLAQTEVRAPFAGVMGLRQFSPGDMVQPGQALVTLTAGGALKADIRLPETQARQVHVGQALELSLAAFPDLQLPAKVVAIEPALDSASRALVVRIQLLRADSRLHPGMTAQARFVLPNAGGGVVVPESAVVAQGGKWVVYKVQGKMAVQSPVKTGARAPGKVTLLEGVQPGDVIVVSGQNKLPMPSMPVMTVPQREAP